MRRKNKNVGARVVIDKLLIKISAESGWQYEMQVYGTIVERGNHEHYYHTSNGSNTYTIKWKIDDDVYLTYAIKLDNNLVDIEGNNVVVVREHNLKFLDYLAIAPKTISEKEYQKAKEIVKKYEQQNSVV